MIIEWGFGILIAITVAMLILRIFFSTIFKIISIIWFVMFLGIIGLTVLAYNDASQFTQGFAENNNLFLLESEDEIIAGFVKTENNTLETVPNLAEIEAKYKEGGKKEILEEGEYYIMFVVDEESFDKEMDLDLGNFNTTKTNAIQIIKSADSLDEYEALFRDNGYIYKENSKSNEKVRSVLFQIMFFSFYEEDPLFIFDNHKKGNIEVYEENLVFKIVKIFPLDLVKELMGKEVK